MARVLDLYGHFNRYNVSHTCEEADLRARVCDWVMVQRDLDEAWGKLLEENPKYMQELVAFIEQDHELKQRIMRLAVKEEKCDELEVATQGA